jgi:thiol:disulfide interchange protein DsbD
MMRSLGFAALLGALLTGAAPAGQELLEPEQAFRFTVGLATAGTLEVTYRIARGYYLYKDRFQFSVDKATVRLGKPEFPPALWHDDEFFGRSEIYRDAVTIRIPLQSSAEGDRFTFLAVSQGCADLGVCFLPVTQKAWLTTLRPG